MATAEQMRRLHPDPPTRHDDYQRAVRDALAWRVEWDEWTTAAPGDRTAPSVLLGCADGIIAALLRYGTPGDPS